MWFQKFLQIIDQSFIGKIVASKTDIVTKTNPEKIYVENIRRFFNVPYLIAEKMCDQAVRFGYFEKYFGYLCPYDDQIIYSTTSRDLSPEKVVTCQICEELEREKFEFEVKDLKKMIFYRLNPIYRETHAVR